MSGKHLSFKVKIVLLATLMSGLVALGMAWFSLTAAQRIGLERLDRELQALGDAHLAKPQPPHHWEHVYDSLLSTYGDDRLSQHILQAHRRDDGQLLFRSPEWPKALILTPESLGISPACDAQSFHGGPFPIHPLASRPEDFGERSHNRPPPPQLNDNPPPPEMDHAPFQPPELESHRPMPMQPPPPMHVLKPIFMTRTLQNRTWRLAIMGNDDVVLIIGADLAEFHAEIQRIWNAFLVATPVALLLLACAGWVLAGLTLRPVRVITRVAEEIDARDLSRRVPPMTADQEFQRLIDVINGMLARMERSFKQATRFSADAAHELKTPLTILQGQLEQAVQQATPESQEQRTCAGLLEEVQRLKVIVHKLLLLTKADAGQMRLNRDRLDFSEMAQSVADDLPGLAEGLRITTIIEPGAWVTGDADLLNQALQNLATNAVKFNDARGEIDITLRQEQNRLLFSISNTGPGIPPEEQGEVFERFYRADKSRNRRVDGSGLGLSLAREIIQAHGGTLALGRSDAEKTTFILILPLN